MRHLALAIALLALPLAVAACGKSGGGQPDPAAVGAAFVDAVNARDKAAVAAIFPTDEQLRAAISCEEPRLFERVAKMRARMASELDDDLAGVTLTWGSHTERDRKELKAGEEVDGCKALQDVTVVRAKWTFSVTKGGETEEEGEGVELIKIGDAGWFLARM